MLSHKYFCAGVISFSVIEITRVRGSGGFIVNRPWVQQKGTVSPGGNCAFLPYLITFQQFPVDIIKSK